MSRRAKTPEQLLADIGDTRLEISATLDQLQQQTSPEALRAQVQKTSLRAVNRLGTTAVRKVDEMTGNVGEKITQKGNDLVEVIREHPLSASLIGVGVGLLLAASLKSSQRRSRKHGGSPLATAREKIEARRDVESAKAASETEPDAQAGAMRGRGNPLAVGIVAAALGIAIGLLIPSSRYENGTLGRVRDEFIARAKEGVQGAAAAAKDTVNTAVSRVREEAERRGLTPEEVRKRAEEKVERAEATAREEAEEQGWSN